MSDKILCKAYLKEALGTHDGDGLMLLISPELKPKAEAIIKELNFKLRIELCPRFPTGYWVLF